MNEFDDQNDLSTKEGRLNALLVTLLDRDTEGRRRLHELIEDIFYEGVRHGMDRMLEDMS